MDWDVVDVHIVGEFLLKVRFKDDVEGILEFSPSFFRGVFAHLREQTKFERVFIDDGVITWPKGLDLAPDAMHREIKTHGKWILI